MIMFCGNCGNNWGIAENPMCLTCNKTAIPPTNWVANEDQQSTQAFIGNLERELEAKAKGMDTQTFERLLDEQVGRCKDVLVHKAKEYATGDRLHNFRVAADLQGCTAIQALSGMMAKHTVSVYDMCESGKDYPIDLWQEKITDSINYMLLLNALVREDSDG